MAQELSKLTDGTYLRIDTIEQGLRELCNFKVGGEGYRLSYRIAEDNLKLGKCVIADSCNPITLTRKEWEAVAINANANSINIEIICSNLNEHKSRVEQRESTTAGLILPDWEAVRNREYHPWESGRILLDTAGKTVSESVQELLVALKSSNGSASQAKNVKRRLIN